MKKFKAILIGVLKWSVFPAIFLLISLYYITNFQEISGKSLESDFKVHIVNASKANSIKSASAEMDIAMTNLMKIKPYSTIINEAENNTGGAVPSSKDQKLTSDQTIVSYIKYLKNIQTDMAYKIFQETNEVDDIDYKITGTQFETMFMEQLKRDLTFADSGNAVFPTSAFNDKMTQYVKDNYILGVISAVLLAIMGTTGAVLALKKLKQANYDESTDSETVIQSL